MGSPEWHALMFDTLLQTSSGCTVLDMLEMRHHQWAQNQGHHSTDLLDERSVTFELFHEQHCGKISERQGGTHTGLSERVDLV